MGNLRTITIERQYASGGREIGKRLSEKLGIPFYDGQLLMLAAEKYGLNPEEVKANDEKVNRSLLYSVAAAVENFRGNDRGMLPYRIYQAQAETIRRLSMEGPLHIYRPLRRRDTEGKTKEPECIHIRLIHGGKKGTCQPNRQYSHD